MQPTLLVDWPPAVAIVAARRKSELELSGDAGCCYRFPLVSLTSFSFLFLRWFIGFSPVFPPSPGMEGGLCGSCVSRFSFEDFERVGMVAKWRIY